MTLPLVSKRCTKMLALCVAFVGAAMFAVLVSSPPAVAQPVDAAAEVQAFVNGQEVDSEPGKYVGAGNQVVLSYEVTNTGTVALSDLFLTQDASDPGGVACDANTIAPGESTTCSTTQSAIAGQYASTANLLATAVDDAGVQVGSAVSAQTEIYYFGVVVGVDIELSANGFDADAALQQGDSVAWVFRVTNTGNVPLFDFELTDSDGLEVDCPFNSSAPGESMDCVAESVVTAGEYVKVGSVRAKTGFNYIVTDEDPINYTVIDTINLDVLVNNVPAGESPGPQVPSGEEVEFLYQVTNTGDSPLVNVEVQHPIVGDGGIDCGAGTPTVVGSLAPGDSVVCVGTGVADVGNFTDTALVVADRVDDSGTQLSPFSATSPVFYFGGYSRLAFRMEVNDQFNVRVVEGADLVFTYRVANLGNVPLTDIVITDESGRSVTCPGYPGNVIDRLEVTQVVTCVAEDLALVGDYMDLGRVTAIGFAPTVVEVTRNVTYSVSRRGTTYVTSGEVVSRLYAAQGESNNLFILDVPIGVGELVVSITGDGDADLYVRGGSAPTETEYDCRPFLAGSTETCTIANPEPGRWFIWLLGYGDFSNATMVATAEVLEERVLTEGVAKTGLAGVADSETPFVFAVPENIENLKVTLTGPGDADLYVAAGSTVGLDSWDCRPYVDLTSDEQCDFANPTPGTWSVMVHGYRSFDDVSISVSWESIYLPVLDVSVPSAPLSGGLDDEYRFKFTAPAYSAFSVTMEGDGDADLYVRAASRPTLNEWDCRPYVDGSSNEECVFPGARWGVWTWFVTVRGYLEFSDVIVTVQALE